MADSVLVVAAHPDGEVLGCGGTIARHGDAGDQVQVLIVVEGATSRQKQRDRDQFGAELLDIPDNHLDSLDRLDLIELVEVHIYRYQPQIVVTNKMIRRTLTTTACIKLWSWQADLILAYSSKAMATC